MHLLELADLLTEIEAAKSEGYLSGLSFQDTARGVNPIIEKLPHYLQEQRIVQGTHHSYSLWSLFGTILK